MPVVLDVVPGIIQAAPVRHSAGSCPGCSRAGQTLVSSLLADGFSPELVKNGTTENALRMVLDRTSFRIRILTKNATVGSARWLDLFLQHPGRFVVGLSTGTMDDRWARKVEIGTSPPQPACAHATTSSKPACSPTACSAPSSPTGNRLEELVDAVNPAMVEHVWAEPFNDRANWRVVRDGYSEGSSGYQRFTEVFERRDQGAWSAYATELYVRLWDKARTEGWLSKLRYLLSELGITSSDAPAFGGLEGVLLQSKPDDDGFSKNPDMAALTRNGRRRARSDTTGPGAADRRGRRRERSKAELHSRVERVGA